MGMDDWKDKRVIVVGAARQGIALGRYLVLHGARVVLNDKKPVEQLESARKSIAELGGKLTSRIEWQVGSHPVSLLDGADLVCVSGGIPLELPLIQEAIHRGIPLSNDSQIFLEQCPCQTIGITGSAGKTTTTSLVGKIAETAFTAQIESNPAYRKVWVGGNIGSPLISVVDKMATHDLAVMELSSFQLELMTRSVNIACVLNITPNHLDRHASMADYIAAKRRLVDFQSKQDACILGQDDPVAWDLLDTVPGRRYSFGRNKPPEGMQGAFIEKEWVCVGDRSAFEPVLKQSAIPLRGWHNVENILAACAISLAAGLAVEAMREAITVFTGVPHRLEWVHSWKGADWYNDSIATAPERVIAAIHSFESPADIHRPIVLLAGGRDKNLPWNDLAELIHNRVDVLILFGEAANKIAAAMGKNQAEGRPYTIKFCDGLEEAVNAAAQVVKPGDIVLLSPGGTSFDEFRDFEERGEAFKRWVLNLS
jgi:UDP-N-acetylmuramoylalanine--D-glutamate ligase